MSPQQHHVSVCLYCVFVSPAVVLTSCDFNQNSEPFCKFTQDTNDHSDWTRHQGRTPTPGTGPSGDYPDGSQFWMSVLFKILNSVQLQIDHDFVG